MILIRAKSSRKWKNLIQGKYKVEIMKNKTIEEVFQLVRNGSFTKFQKAISKLDTNITNELNQSLLHEAIVYREDEIGNYLIDNGIDLFIKDNKGQTALHYSSLHNNLILARKIIRNGGDVNIKDKYGNSCLWTATFNARGNYDMVSLFIQANGNPTSKNNMDKSPIDFATQINDNELLKILNTGR